MNTRQSLQRSLFLVPAALALGWTAAVNQFPATGQTTCWDSSGTVIPCAGTGQDGDIQAGKTLKYKDNGNGTIKDKVTGLTWEKKSDDSTIHDKDNTYTWDNGFVFVNTLNNICANDESVNCSVNGDADCARVGGKCGFAGKRDWRVPNIKELQSIVNSQVPFPGPVVSQAFNDNCIGSTVLTGSCTVASNYWSSTTNAGFPTGAWRVFFFNGLVGANVKDGSLHVRGVRGGLH